MPNRESDLVALEPLRRIPRALRHIFNACVVVGGLVGGGVSVGYFLGAQQERSDALAEIQRLQEAYGVRIERAATATTSAAVAVTTAAEVVGEAAADAATAATAARTAAAAAKSAAAPASAPRLPPSPTRGAQ